MRRLVVPSIAAVVLATATPAIAQSSETAGSSSGQLIVVFAAVAAALSAFLLIVILFGKSRSTSKAAVQSRLGALAGDKSSGGVFGKFSILRRAARSAESAAASRGATNMIENALDQANVPLKAGEAIIAAFGFSMITFLVVTAFTQSAVWGVVGGTLLLIFSLLFVNNVASRQRKRFEGQLPDTLNLLSTSLRAGYSLLQAIEAVGEEAPEPTRREFGRAIAEIRLGRQMDDALSDIAERMASQDFDWTVLAINIQREVGGNLAEVLQTTAETMVQRNRLRREMKALTAEGRISAIVLSVMPILLFIAISVLNPGYLEPLLESTIGLIIIGGGLVFMGIGIVWMQKIVKVDA
ncbi:MAG: type II secretion system F family protein [Actinomycetia bacterium]|nr:type II secretion system F family protein [Actinomycetes bacterium]